MPCIRKFRVQGVSKKVKILFPMPESGIACEVP